MKNKIGIVIPCYREKGNINKVIEDIFSVFEYSEDIYDFNIYLIDDCCPDKSWKEVKKKENIIIFHNYKNMGVGGACIAGFKKALQDKCDLIIKMDADGQHNASYLIDLISFLLKIDRNKLVMLKGSRYLWPELSNKTPLNRKIGSLLLEPMIRSSLNYRGLTDIANGFLATNSITLDFLLLNKFGPRLRKRYLFECSILEKCSSMDIEIYEFGMLSRYSKNWKSSMNSSKMIFPLLIFCSRSIFRRILYSYIFKINLGTILLFITISNLFLAFKLYFQKISVEVALGITVSAGISTLFTSAITLFILFLCLFLFYDYSSGSKVRKVIFKILIDEIKNKNG